MKRLALLVGVVAALLPVQAWAQLGLTASGDDDEATGSASAGSGQPGQPAQPGQPGQPRGPAQAAPGSPVNPGPLAPGAQQTMQLQGRPIARIQFRGNRKVEDDAIRVQLLSKAGALFDAAKLRDDLRAMWRLNFFADIAVEAETEANGSVVLTFAVKERPSIRKVLIAGNSEVGLDKINEVLDLELDTIVDIAKIKRNRDKIADQYVQKGYYLATVDYEIKPVNDTEVDVWFNVDEKAKVKIRDVEFIGNNSIPTDELRDVLQTRRADALSFINDSGVYSQEAFERDLLLVSAHYWDKGFANVKVGNPQLRLSRDKQYMYLSIPVDEGPVFTISSVNFKGDLIGGAGANLRRVLLRPGNKFSRTVIAEDRERLSAFYQDQGYAYANVLPLTKPDLVHHTIALTFEIARGKRAYFERINIRGNAKTRDKVIRREMKISEGELFNNTNLEISKKRIQALGFFENVTISTKRGSSDEFVEVNVEVTERATGTFQIGAGFSSVENFIAQAQISQNNLFGRGQTLALQAQISSLRQLFLLRFVEPYFLDTFLDVRVRPLQPEPLLRHVGAGGDGVRAQRDRWNADLGLSAHLRGARVPDLQARGRHDHERLARLRQPGLDQHPGRGAAGRQPVPRRLHVVGQGIDLVGLAQQPVVPERGLVRAAVRRVREPVHGIREQVRPLRRVHPSLPPAVGAVRPQGQRRGRHHDVDGPARRADQRALPRRRHLTTSAATRRCRSDPACSWPSRATSASRSAACRSAATCRSSSTARSSSRCSRRSASPAWCSSTPATPTTSKVATAPACSAPIPSPIQFDPCFRFPESLTDGIRRSVGFGFRWFSPIGPLRFEWGIPLDAQVGEQPLVFEFTIGNFF